MQVRKVTPPRRRTSDESWSVYKCRPGCLGCNTKLLGILLIVIAIAYRLQVIASTVVSLIPARGGTLSDWQWEVPIVTNLDADTVLPTTAAPVLPGESFPCSDDTFQKYMDPPIARIHCLGETFNETRPDTPAALYRSCHYDNMCYHVQEKRLVLFPSPHHWTLLSKLHANIHLSSVSKPVMASAVRRLITDPTAQVTPQYYPTNVNYNNIQNKSSDYYVRTDTKVVLVPIQPESCQSILWDVYLPVYTLLEQFDLQHKPYRLLLLGEAANAHCTRHQLDAFAAMMGFNASDIVSFHGTTTQNYNNTGRKDNNNGMIVEDDGPQFVCYHRSVMGMGRLGDYEMIRPENYSSRHVPPAHIGRQSNFRGFRKHWLQRMGLPHTTMITPGSEGGTKPFRVVYSTSAVASNDWKPLSTNVPGLEFVPWNPEKDRSSLREQIQWMNKTAILILSSDQDKTVAFFLPEGATLILLGDAPVDWDLWNNNALLRVHLVRDSTQETVDCLIRDELSRLEDNNDPPNTAKAEHRADFDQNNRSIALIYGKPPISRIHCVGEKQFPDRNAASWYRSCYFKNLCFDLSTKSFVVFPSPTTLVLMKSASRHNYYSSIPSMLVASPQPSKLVGGYLSGIPQIHSAENVSSYYYLEGAWLATMTFNSGNMGHLLWDVWLPIYTLLEMFGLTQDKLFVSRQPSTSDAPRAHKLIEQLFGFPARITPNEFLLNVSDAKSKYVCASHGASGYGWLTDHGHGTHGWNAADLEYPINVRRGPELRRLRNYMLNNGGVRTETALTMPYLVVFSPFSSRRTNRRLDFKEQIAAVQSLKIANVQFRVRRPHLVSYPIMSQLEIASKTAIYISAVGGGTFPAYFLPKGATLILYGDRDMFLDFDLFNNYGQVRVHWMSLESRLNDTDILVDIIRDELEALARSHAL